MERSQEFLDDIVIVVVLYNCTPENSNTIKSLINSLTQVKSSVRPLTLLYDNSPDATNPENLNKLADHLAVRYIHDASNPGVSKPYNVAARWANDEAKSLLLLLDQDTVLSDNSIVRYSHSINKFPDVHLFCPLLQSGHRIYSPCKYFIKRGFFWKNILPGKHSLKHKSALNSGLLVRRSAFEKTGGFNEKIKLYFSDFEFIDRFRQHYEELCVVDALFFHELSDSVFLDRQKAVTRFRHYVEGARHSVKSLSDWIQFFVTVGLRSIKLSFSFKSRTFVGIFTSVFLQRPK